MKQEANTLKTTIVQGFGTLIIREFFIKAFSFLGQLFLARLLLPSDFGTYVIIAFIIGFVGLFSDVGLSLAIIQKKEQPTPTELSSIFTLKMLIAVVLILLVWIFSPVAKFIYPSFTQANIFMIRVFAITLFFANLRSIPVSLLERKIKYSVISTVDIIGVCTYYVVAIIGALSHIGVWSFILGALIKEFLETVFLFYVEPFSPNIQFNIKSLKTMFTFGLFIQGNNIVTFFNNSITPIIGGRLNGTYAVGLLDFSNNIASLPETIAINFGRVAFTGYSRIQEQKELLFKAIQKSANLLAILLYIFPVIILSFGGELIRIIFTEKWIAAVPALYWFSATAFFHPVIASLGQGILATGKSKELFRSTLIATVLGFISAYVLVHLFGFVGIAVTNFLISSLLCFLYTQILKKSGFDLKYLIPVAPKLLAAFLTIILSILITYLFPKTAIFLMIKLFIGLSLYLVLMFFFSKKDTKELFTTVRTYLTYKKI